jgi:hypothetical protein
MHAFYAIDTNFLFELCSPGPDNLFQTRNPSRERAPMARIHRTILERLPRLTAPPQQAGVHFHQGPQGQPAPCFDDHCANPRLSV